MSFHIDRYAPWVEAKLELEEKAGGAPSSQTSRDPVDYELADLASVRSNEYDDVYISKGDLRRANRTNYSGRPITKHLVSNFLKSRISERRELIRSRDGHIIEDLRVFDNSDNRFQFEGPVQDNHLRNQQIDLIVRRVETPLGDKFENITQEVLESVRGILKWLIIPDPETQGFTNKENAPSLKSLFDNIKSGTEPELTPEQEAKWANSDYIFSEMNLDLILMLYRFFRVANTEDSRFVDVIEFSMVRRIIDSAVTANRRKRNPLPFGLGPKKMRLNQVHYRLENKLASNFLIGFLNADEEDPEVEIDPTYLDLVAIQANHLIDMTDGEYGVDVLQSFSHDQWHQILQNDDVTLSIFSTLSNAVYVQSLTFYRDLFDEDKDLRFTLIKDVLLKETEEAGNCIHFQSLVASALLSGMRIQTDEFGLTIDELLNSNNQEEILLEQVARDYCEAENTTYNQYTIGDLIFKFIDNIHETDRETTYPFSSMANVGLSAFAKISKKPGRMPDQVQRRSIDWSKKFLQEFRSFPPVEREDLVTRTVSRDREAFLLGQKVLASLSASEAQQFFFDDLMGPLDPTFNPRTDKHLAHNSYYRKVGGAERLASVSGQPRLAFRRRLDQDNNEWGRDFEKKVRQDAIFRLDVLKEAESSLNRADTTSVQKIVEAYDPDGILQRNFAFVHVMRHFFLGNIAHNPTSIEAYERLGLQRVFEDQQQRTLRDLNVGTLIETPIPPQVYIDRADEFDDWIEHVRAVNPKFFRAIMDKILEKEDLSLSFEIFFMEANEVETFQYYLDPVVGPQKLFQFVGKIRSWTSGYQGRVLTRVQMFMDQDALANDTDHELDPENFKPHYSQRVSESRFEDEETGVMAFLQAGLDGPPPEHLEFSDEEAYMILQYFSETGFSAYLPQWIFFIIDHDFRDENGYQNLNPAIKAFEVLETTRFPRRLMKQLFEERGYIGESQPEARSQEEIQRKLALEKAALKTLKHLPKGHLHRYRFSRREEMPIRKPIIFASKKTIRYRPEKFDRLMTRFEETGSVGPGEYRRYRPLAKRLLKTHRLDALQAIVDQALTYTDVEYPLNKPLVPLFKGLIGLMVSDPMLEGAIENIAIATDDGKPKGLAGLVDFSGILVRWADRNNIDLNEVFGQAFDAYEPPESIRVLQDEVERLSTEIDEVQTRRTSVFNDLVTKEKDFATQVSTYNEQFSVAKATFAKINTRLYPQLNQDWLAVQENHAHLLQEVEKTPKQWDVLRSVIAALETSFTNVTEELTRLLTSRADQHEGGFQVISDYNSRFLRQLKEEIYVLRTPLGHSAESTDQIQDFKEELKELDSLLLGTENSLGYLELRKRKERERNQKIAELSVSRSSYGKKALTQVLTFVYNTVKQQYLKEVLITGGEVTGEIIEDYLQNDLIPERESLARDAEASSEQRHKEISQRIEFLMSVLAQMESVEYFNDFNASHSRTDRYKRSVFR